MCCAMLTLIMPFWGKSLDSYLHKMAKPMPRPNINGL